MADTFSRIYQLQTAGVDKVLTDVNAVIARLEVLGRVKNQVSNSDIGDPAEVAALNTQYNNLVATVDKMAKSQEGLSESLAQVIELQRGVTMSMKESTQALGANVSAGTAGLTKLQASFAITNDAAAQMVQTSTELGERLAVVKDNIAATTQQLKILDKEYTENKVSQEEFEVEGGRLNVMLIEQRAEAQYLTQILKAQAIAQDALAGSTRDARAQIALLNREQENLIVTRTKDVQITDEEIAANVARRDAIIAEKNALHDFLAANADKNLSRVLNIGNYPSLSAELTQLKKDMQALVIAGEQDSEAFATMQARSLELSGAIKEVNAATKEATATMGRFDSVVQRMGLRMLANLLIFQLVIEVFNEITKAWKESTDRINYQQVAMANVAKESANAFGAEATEIEAMKHRWNDLGTTLEDKKEIVDELNDKFETQIGKINGVSDAEQFFITKSDAFLEAIQLRAKAMAALSVITQTYVKELTAESNPKETVSWWQKAIIAGGKAEDMISHMFGGGPLYGGSKNEGSFGDRANDQGKRNVEQIKEDAKNTTDFLLKEYDRLMNEARALDDKYGFNTDTKAGKGKAGKQPHDYTNAILEAQKKLTDGIAKELELRLQIEMAGLRKIYENTELSLQLRVKAYAEYVSDELTIAKIANETQVKDVQDKLSKIAEIEKKDKSKRTVEENVLLLNKPQLLKSLDDLKLDLELKMKNISLSINSGVSNIVKSNLDTQFKDIDAELNQKFTEIEDRYGVADNEIYGSKKSNKSKAKSIDKLSQGEAVEKDEAKLIDDQKKIDATIEAQQQAHDANLVDLEKELTRKLRELYKQQADDRAKYLGDKNKHNEVVTAKQVADATINIVQSFANAEMEILAKRDAYRQEMALRSLEYNKKQLDGETQSMAQKRANDKADYIAHQQLEKQKAIDAKKRAQTLEIINFVIASGKNFADHEFYDALLNEAALAAEFAAKEAVLSSAPAYARGTGSGTHPGGLAYVGDGGEPELIRIGNKIAVSPSTTTLTNLPAGAQVTPFSQLGGNLKAPSFNVSNSSGGDMSGLHASIAAQSGQIAHIAAGLQNMQINYDPAKATRANNNHYYKSVKV